MWKPLSVCAAYSKPEYVSAGDCARVHVCVCFSSQMSLNRTPSALQIPAATGEHLTSSRLLLDAVKLKVCAGPSVCVCVWLYSEPCQIKTTKQTVRVTQTGEVLCTIAVVSSGLLCLFVCYGKKKQQKQKKDLRYFFICIFYLFAKHKYMHFLWRRNRRGCSL